MRGPLGLLCLMVAGRSAMEEPQAVPESSEMKQLKLQLWQRGVECRYCSDEEALKTRLMRLRHLPILTMRGGCSETHCAPDPPDLARLTASLGPDFAAAIQGNEKDHAADCARSCKTFYCGPQGPAATIPEVSAYSMGDVAPEDFAADFRFPLDLIKVTKTPLFTSEECAAIVAQAEAEDVHLNEYTSGKYRLGGDWIRNMPKTLEWFNGALRDKIFPTLASLFPEIISGPEVLRAHSVAMLKYNSSHPRTDVHVDNGVIALTLALTPWDK